MPMAAKLGRVVTCRKGFPPIKSNDPLIACPARSRDRLKTYLHYQSANDHQTWQDNLPR